jgi:glucose/arabinose dehydrogenase
MSNSGFTTECLNRFAWLACLVASVALVSARAGHSQSIAVNAFAQSNFSSLETIGTGVGGVTQMAFGPDGRLYVATFGGGVLRYDYSPTGTLSNKTTVWSRPNDFGNGVVNGSLGVAFHEDDTLGTVMYIAPAVTSGFNVALNFTQSIVRLTDNDQDGNWGETGAGEINQAIVDNLRVTDLHQVNQMVVRDDTLYVGIGSRTRTGGQVNGVPQSELGGAPNPDDGEFAYTGSINWIRDLTLLSANTSTANIAGHNITSHHTDTTPFTSTDEGKLTVYSTGFRNVYGLAFDTAGELWATMNQNENPQKPDELHQSNFQDDHKFPKANEVSGDWKLNGDAIAAGFFDTFKDPVSLLGNNASADGIAFTDRNAIVEDYALIVRYSNGDDLIAVDKATGAITQAVVGLSNPLDVMTDPFGNLLIGQHGGGGQIFRLNVSTEVFPFGDFNQDNAINGGDWAVIRDNYRADLTGLTIEQAYAMGDLNQDLLINRFDLSLFKNLYEDFNGAGTFAQLGVQVPEPQTLLILAFVIFGAALSRHWRHPAIRPGV